MRDYTFINVPAGATRRIGVDGNFLRVKSSPVDLSIQYELADGGNPAELTLGETGYFRLPGDMSFFYVLVTNASPAPVSFTVTSGFGYTGDNLLTGSVEINDALVTAGHSQVTVTSAGVTIDGASNRKTLVIQNIGSADVWLDAVNGGLRLGAGQSLDYYGTRDLLLITDSADALVNLLDQVRG